MKLKFLVISGMVAVWCFEAGAGVSVEMNVQPPVPQPAHVMPAPPPPMPIMVRPKNKIWTPDRYHCYMRQNKKYCADYKGRALSGRIVVTDAESASYETYMSGYRSGETSVYSLSGVLLERTMYKKGLKNGESIRYYMNGNVHQVAKYKDGVLHGRVDEYDINGALLGQMNYKKGWFKDGYCRNEKGGHTMKERLTTGQYNEIIPCGEAQ